MSVLSPVDDSIAFSWSPDGEWLVVADLEGEKLNGISLLPFRRGDRCSLVSAPVSTQRYGWPSFSPEGDRLAFAACSGARSCDLYLQDLGPGYVPRGEPKRLTHQGVAVVGLAWAPDGQSLIDSASSDLSGGFHLRRVGLDAEKAPERVLLAGDFAYLPAVSKSGDKLAYAEWRELFEAGKLSGATLQFFQPKPPEMLFDVEADPHEVHNLAGDDAHAGRIKTMTTMIQDWQQRLGDTDEALSMLREYRTKYPRGSNATDVFYQLGAVYQGPQLRE